MFFYLDVDILIFLPLVKRAGSKGFHGFWCSFIVSILTLKFLMKTESNTQSLYKLGLSFNLNEIDISTS